MSDFAVFVSSVASTAGATDTAHCELSAELARLRAINDEVCSGWRGSAAVAFEQAWSMWLAGAVDVVADLERLAESLRDTAHAYAVRDASAAVGLRLTS